MATVEEVFEELNLPSSQKLRRVLDSRGIAYERQDVEKLMRSEAVRQVQAPAYKFDGTIAAHCINDRFFCDLIDFSAAPSDWGKRIVLRETKEGEVYILVVQDVFSSCLWKEALTSKRPEIVAKAFEDIMTGASVKPKTVTSDLGRSSRGPLSKL